MVERIDALPQGTKEAARDHLGRVVLALGEASGHAHALRGESVTAFRFESAEDHANRAMVDFLHVGGSGAPLRHEYDSGSQAEHEEVLLAAGFYRVIQQREYSPQEIRRVID